MLESSLSNVICVIQIPYYVTGCQPVSTTQMVMEDGIFSEFTGSTLYVGFDSLMGVENLQH